MKIILVHCQYQHPGGEDVVLEQEQKLLERAGHQVVLYQRTNYEVDQYPGVKRLVLLQKAVWNSDSKDSFAELLRAEKPDLVHIHNTWIMISPSIYSACIEAGVPVVQTLHNYRLLCPVGTFFRDGKICEECLDHTLWRSLRNGCYRDSRAETAAVGIMLSVHRRRQTWEREVNSYIALTEFSRSKFLRGGMPADRIFVKPNFVDPDPGVRSGDGEYAIFVGRLFPERRVSTLLEAWPHLRTRVPLLIVGGGAEREGLEKRVLDNNLDMIKFTGFLPHEQAVAAIRGARFLIFCSEWYETFGMTMIEAFACGVPVICSKMGAMQEIVADGLTGLHFSPGDYRDLAEKVEWAWNHPERMRQMGEAARHEYESKYTAEKNYPRLMEVYRRAISDARKESPAHVGHPSPAQTAASSSIEERVPETLPENIGIQAPVLSSRSHRSLKVVLGHNYYQIPGGEDEALRRDRDLLRSAGHQVKEFIRHNNEITRSNIVTNIRLAAKTVWSEDSRKAMLQFLKDEKPDIVHFHNTFPLISPSVYYACRAAGVPVLQTLHNPRLFCPGGSLARNHQVCEDCKGKTVPWPAVLHACYRQSRSESGVLAAMLAIHWQLRTWQDLISIYIVSTPFYRQKFVEAGFPADKIVVKPHFVEDPRVARRPGDYALFVGRLAAEKGVPTLLRAWNKLSHIPLKIRGEGPLLPDVEELARRSRGTVVVLPRLDRRGLNELMSRARFLIWPSEGYYETFGYVAVEAFACGVPVIASKTGVAEEIVQDHRTGLHFIAGDPEDLAAKATWAWAHTAEMEEMGRTARAEYEAKYTPQRNYLMLMDIYSRAMSIMSPQKEETAELIAI